MIYKIGNPTHGDLLKIISLATLAWISDFEFKTNKVTGKTLVGFKPYKDWEKAPELISEEIRGLINKC